METLRTAVIQAFLVVLGLGWPSLRLVEMIEVLLRQGCAQTNWPHQDRVIAP